MSALQKSKLSPIIKTLHPSSKPNYAVIQLFSSYKLYLSETTYNRLFLLQTKPELFNIKSSKTKTIWLVNFCLSSQLPSSKR